MNLVWMNDIIISSPSIILKNYRYLEKGELLDEITKRKFISEEDIAYIIKQLLSATTYWHSKGIIHRDLRLKHILIESVTSTGKINIKVINVGKSLFVESNTKIIETLDSIYCSAPELLKGTYNEKCDIWSIGVILYILLCGCPPINGKTDEDLMNNIIKGEYNFEGKFIINKR